MSYIDDLAVETGGTPGTAKQGDSYSGASIPLDGLLTLLKRSDAPAQVAFVKRLLLEHVSSQQTGFRGSEETRLSRVEVLLRMLRGSRTAYEAVTVTKALRDVLAAPEINLSGLLTAEEELEQGGRSSPQSPANVLHGVSVLVIEDDANYQKLLKTILSRNGASVVTTDNVDDAMQIITSESPDVIVTDIELPKASGYELMKRLRKDGTDIPVLAISGIPQDRRDLRRSGFRWFLAKQPGVPEEVVKAITHLPGLTPSPRLPIVKPTLSSAKPQGVPLATPNEPYKEK